MKKNFTIQETNELLHRMKLLMNYDTKKTLTENKKSLIIEAPQSFPTSPKYSTDEIKQVYQNNRIKSPDGKFSLYAPSNIIITDIFDTTADPSNWVANDGSKFTGSTGQLWNKELFQEFLNIPSVSSFEKENGDEMRAYITQKKGGDPKDKFNGYYFKGYYVYNSSGEGTKNVLYKGERPQTPYNWKTDDPKDNTGLVSVKISKDKPIEFGYQNFPKATTITYEISNNNTDRPLKIEKVEIYATSYQSDYLGQKNAQEWMDEVTDFEFTSKEIPPNYTGYVIVKVDMSRLINLKSLYEKVKNNRYYGGGSPSLIDDGNQFDYNLLITTSEGQLRCSVNKANLENRVEQHMRIAGEKFEQRLTPNLEITTPKGFSPFCYEDFLTELYEIITNPLDLSCAYSKEWDKYFLDESGKIISNKFPRPSTLPSSVQIAATKEESKTPSNNCRVQITNLINKYYDEKFPTGICPELKIKFKQELSTAKQKLKEFEESHQFEVTNFDMDGTSNGTVMEFVYNYLTDEQKDEYNKLKAMVSGTIQNYGYDNRNAFDYFIDEWLIWAQLGIATITTICTMGGAAPWLVGAATAADIIMNVSVGTYQLAKGDTKEAALSFFFACLPQIHKIYGKVANIFKAEELTVDVTKSLAEKISSLNEGLLNTPKQMEQFLASGFLTKEESLIFRKSMSLSENDFKNVFSNLENFAEKTSKVRKIPGIVKFGATIYTDFKVMKTIEDLHDKTVEFINQFCKNCIETEQEKRAAKTYMNNLSPNQQLIMRIYLEQIALNVSLSNEQKAVLSSDVIKGKKDFIIKEKAKLIEGYTVTTIPKEKAQQVRDEINKEIQEAIAGQKKKEKYITFTDKQTKKQINYTEDDFIKIINSSNPPIGTWFYNGNNEEVLKYYNDMEDSENGQNIKKTE
jgi:hypothetical protein